MPISVFICLLVIQAEKDMMRVPNNVNTRKIYPLYDCLIMSKPILKVSLFGTTPNILLQGNIESTEHQIKLEISGETKKCGKKRYFSCYHKF